MIYDRIHHSQIGVDFIMLYVMIEALHIPFILIADLLYTYAMQFSTCYCGYRSYGCRHTLIFTLCDLRVDVVGAEGGLSVGTYD
jgi:hypothetical protein